jgi:hypothetical protein
MEGQVPVFISPRNRMAQLNPSSYDSQGYGGGILSRLHTGIRVQFVPHRKHHVSSTKTDGLTLFRKQALFTARTIKIHCGRNIVL